jgi:hypothetical protein
MRSLEPQRTRSSSPPALPTDRQTDRQEAAHLLPRIHAQLLIGGRIKVVQHKPLAAQLHDHATRLCAAKQPAHRGVGCISSPLTRRPTEQFCLSNTTPNGAILSVKHAAVAAPQRSTCGAPPSSAPHTCPDRQTGEHGRGLRAARTWPPRSAPHLTDRQTRSNPTAPHPTHPEAVQLCTLSLKPLALSAEHAPPPGKEEEGGGR